MPGRYQNEDRDDYYNESYRDRDRDYEGRGSSYRDQEERYSSDYRSRGHREDDDHSEYNSPRRENFSRDNRFAGYGSQNDSSKTRSVTGVHRGKGPKGYTRSDDRIKEDVSDALMEDSELDASDIEVSVKKGEVTLQGQVSNRQEKRRAEDCAEACAGVTDVQNNIKIRSATASSGKST
ncbi:BON domain-containing protein [Brucella pseudogrignonensis]|uniref:BON domain-containing protein n=1 Tax=Brucella pseudogrignonensis TaxID=419475 RepID=UPI00124E2177|nr:BON domain-containing protein [Brucella pseudogrignonensis]KAB2684465.1 BON domain-containing protein [Brucella pseudogrignonensis]